VVIAVVVDGGHDDWFDEAPQRSPLKERHVYMSNTVLPQVRG